MPILLILQMLQVSIMVVIPQVCHLQIDGTELLVQEMPELELMGMVINWVCLFDLMILELEDLLVEHDKTGSQYYIQEIILIGQ